ncbi:unnamed protein product [Taenia asiatica]|uniref:Serine/arginine repetitive matrix protein 2-like n=1 Tax=Taenia asiatica TaxID=60517 RepID=A0A0R3VVH6_TAEAS|nr:unnamed protein product [Taenia asiatica]
MAGDRMHELDNMWIAPMVGRTVEMKEISRAYPSFIPKSDVLGRRIESASVVDYSRRKYTNAGQNGTRSTTYKGVDEGAQFNCSAENGLPLDDPESPGEAESLNNSRGECSQALIRLLEDLKNTLVESSKTCNASLRESTIASIETVLRQIRARLSEPVISEILNYKATESCQPRSSDVPTVLREVERSIRSLKEGVRRSSKLSNSPVRPPSLKVNSIELLPTEVEHTNSLRKLSASNQEAASRENTSNPNVVAGPCSSKDPVEPAVTSPQSSEGLKRPAQEDPSSSRHTVEQPSKAQASGCSNADQQRPASVRSRASSSKGSLTPQDSPSIVVAPRAPVKVESRVSNKSTGSNRSGQPTRENASFVKSASVFKASERSGSKRPITGSDRDALEGGSRSSNGPASVKSESAPSKAASEPHCSDYVCTIQERPDSAQPRCSSPKEQLAPPTKDFASNQDRSLTNDMESGSRKLTKLSKILRSFRSYSSRSSRSKQGSQIVNPVELCAKILTICAGTQKATQLQTCSPEALYAKIVSMGPEGEEFLQSAQDYLKTCQSKQPCGSIPQDAPRYSRHSSDSKQSLSKRKESGEMCEAVQIRRSNSHSSIKTPQYSRETSHMEGEATEKCVGRSHLKVGQDRLLEEATGVRILEALKEVRESVQNIETKQDKLHKKVDPEVLELLYDMRNSLNSPNRGYDSDSHDDEAVLCPPRFGYNTGPRKRAVEEVVDNNMDFRSAGSRLLPQCGTRPTQRSKVDMRSSPSQEGLEASEMRKTLNEIRQSISAIECRDASSPGPEVLRMLTEVRDSIRILCTAQQEQTPVQPEVLNALEEIRETIGNVEERTRIAQEQANQEVMAMLESVRQCIRSVEIESSEKSDLKNQQIMATLKEMRQSVCRLETRSAMAERKLNPEVATLLGEIRASIRCMEKSRASQRNAADSTMMNILRDIKGSLVSIEGRASSTSHRPSVNMFVMNGSKKLVNEDILNSLTGIRRSGDIATLPRSSSKGFANKCISSPNQELVQSRSSEQNIQPPSAVSTDPYVKTALDEIRQSMQQITTNGCIASGNMDDPKYRELRESIRMLQQDMRSLLEKQTEVSGQLSRESDAAQLQGLLEELEDIRSGMKCLIDTIPSIVEAVRSEQPSANAEWQDRGCTSPLSRQPTVESVDNNEADLHSPMCKKVLEMLEEMKTVDAMEKEVLQCVRTASSVAEPQGCETPNVNGTLGTPNVALWKTDPAAPAGIGSPCMGSSAPVPVTSPNQLPSTFTLSFVGPQPQALDLTQPMIISINGRTFKCSKMST